MILIFNLNINVRGDKNCPDLVRKFRNTKQKSIILDETTRPKRPSLYCRRHQDILKSKKYQHRAGYSLSFYKAAEDMGEIRKYHISENSSACFEYIGDGSQCKNHCHAMCSICGRVLHIQNELLRLVCRKIKEQGRF